jgi:hypothetical protein
MATRSAGVHRDDDADRRRWSRATSETGAFGFYFSRPVRPIDYVVGKLVGHFGVMGSSLLVAGRCCCRWSGWPSLRAGRPPRMIDAADDRA